jgi:hypothetical protein
VVGQHPVPAEGGLAGVLHRGGVTVFSV